MTECPKEKRLSSRLDVLKLSVLGRELLLPTIFVAHCYANHSPIIYALAALGRLSDNYSGFKLEVVSSG